MKKFISLTIVMLLVLGMFAGCGGESAGGSAGGKTEATETSMPETTVPEETVPETTLGYTLHWPNTTVTQNISRPATDDITIEYLNDDGLRATINNVDRAFYEKYCEQIMADGFEVELIQENAFVAIHASGYEIGLRFTEDEKSITLYALLTEDKDDEIEDPQANVVRPEVKEAIDAYEEFVNEYCEFLEMYNSGSEQNELFNKYMDYIEKYDDLTDELEELSETDMTNAEYEYYLEVMERCTERVWDVEY